MIALAASGRKRPGSRATYTPARTMKILILGSAAGGGFPQWNCNCQLCEGQRSGTRRALARTQSSLAISPDGENWVLINASPDVGQQIRNHVQLQPRRGPRDTPIKAVVLMDAQIDHVTGLLSLREGPPVQLYCTPCVHGDLTNGLRLLPALNHYCGVHWHSLPIEGNRRAFEFCIEAVPTLRYRAIAIPGKAPPYSPHRTAPALGDNVALMVEDMTSGKRLFYAPGLAHVGQAELGHMKEASCLIVDGTFWTENEMVDAGIGTKHARDLGHLPQSGPEGMMAALTVLSASRKILIHVNNSNPILDEDSDQRKELDRHGIEVAHDGLEIDL